MRPVLGKGRGDASPQGSDTITLGEQAELGPLDVQVYEEKQEGRGEYHSALDPLKELEQLESLSLGTLASAMRFIATNYGMSSEDSLRHAMAFVEVTTGSLVGRLDPEMIGRYGRELAVATEYGERLLSTWSRWPPRKISEVVDQLVYGYPSHDYVIDHDELRTMGFDVGRFPEPQLAAVSALLPSLEEVEGSMVQLVEPSSVPSVVTVSAIAGGRTGTPPHAEEGGATPPDAEEREALTSSVLGERVRTQAARETRVGTPAGGEARVGTQAGGEARAGTPAGGEARVGTPTGGPVGAAANESPGES